MNKYLYNNKICKKLLYIRKLFIVKLLVLIFILNSLEYIVFFKLL